MKAFLGTGLLGANFVRAMLQRGDRVSVWNRTASKAAALEGYGATVFTDAAEAVKGADTIHLALKDDDSVNEILASASTGFRPGVIIVDHTTTSAKGAAQRTALWKERGYTYLHAPVFMGPQNALEGTGYMLVSGDQRIISTIGPELSKMTGKLINFGPKEGKAAGMKLTGNLLLLTLTAGISDTLSLAKGLGISAADMSLLFSCWNPGASVPARLQRITEGNFAQPSWELNMARKDAALMIDAAEHAGVKLALIPIIASEMDRWIEKGHGNDDWSVIAKDNI